MEKGLNIMRIKNTQTVPSGTGRYYWIQQTVVLEKKKKKKRKKTHVKEDIQKETYDVYTSECCGEFKNWI